MINTNILENAKWFDEKYIASKQKNVYCSHYGIIMDYLIMKSMTTDQLITTMVVGPSLTSHQQDKINYRINESGLKDHVKRHYKTHVRFKNNSRIYSYSHQNVDLALRSVSCDLLYVDNSSLFEMFVNNGIFNFYTALQPNGRIIFNFDP